MGSPHDHHKKLSQKQPQENMCLPCCCKNGGPAGPSGAGDATSTACTPVKQMAKTSVSCCKTTACCVVACCACLAVSAVCCCCKACKKGKKDCNDDCNNSRGPQRQEMLKRDV